MPEKEYIEREALKKKFCEWCNKEYENEPCEPDECPFRTMLLEAPAADVAEVVRCKDCRFCSNHPTSDRVKMCTNPKWSDEFHPLVQDNDFCSYGVRK